jgi:hypothetical protein
MSYIQFATIKREIKSRAACGESCGGPSHLTSTTHHQRTMKEPQKTMSTRISNSFLRTADLPGQGQTSAKKLQNPAPNPFLKTQRPPQQRLTQTKQVF